MSPASRPAILNLPERVQLRLDALGISAVAASESAGLGRDYIRDILRRRTKKPSADALSALAAVLQTTSDYLIGRSDEIDGTAPIDPASDSATRRKAYPLAVRYDIAAGVWREVDQISQIEPEDSPLRSSPNWPPTEQWVGRVRGDSMNRFYPDGTFVRLVSVFALRNFRPVSGQHVEVIRRREGGALIEITLKEVVVLAGGAIELWPRSTNPKWAEPIRIADGIDPTDENAEVCIHGLVSGHMREVDFNF